MYDDELRSRRHYERRARWYDRANWLAATLRGTSGRRERLKAIAPLGLQLGDRVLEVCVGTGTNLALLAALAPNARMAGLDISRSMLLRCREKLRRSGASAALVEAEATHMPFRSDTFDAVLHHGGLAEFGDQRRALAEVARVARPGARIVVCDVGVPADRKLPLMSRLLLFTQPVYRKPPPLELLPPNAEDVRLKWIGGGAWYMIEFSNGGA